MRPPGIDLAPSRMLAIVNGEDDNLGNPGEYDLPEETVLVIYRHKDGRLYAQRQKEYSGLLKQKGYQAMGSVELLRQLFRSAEKSGVKEKSISWYLLGDVEREVAERNF